MRCKCEFNSINASLQSHLISKEKATVAVMTNNVFFSLEFKFPTLSCNSILQVLLINNSYHLWRRNSVWEIPAVIFRKFNYYYYEVNLIIRCIFFNCFWKYTHKNLVPKKKHLYTVLKTRLPHIWLKNLNNQVQLKCFEFNSLLKDFIKTVCTKWKRCTKFDFYILFLSNNGFVQYFIGFLNFMKNYWENLL
jgi:hypothetical protein